MKTVDDLLAALKGVRKTSPSTWMAHCPSHEDGSPSLSIRLADDKRVLVKCFAGCEAQEVVGAVGMTLRDLFPAGSRDAASGGWEGPPPMDILRAMEADALLVCVIASDLAKGAQLTPERRQKLTKAAGRISAATTIYKGIRNGHGSKYAGV